MTKVAIFGYGWVGKAVSNLFPEAVIHDPAQRYNQLERANQADVAFICVPTPGQDEGALDCGIVAEVVAVCECPLIVIRSTVNPGLCDRLASSYGKRIVYNPEYLGETPQHPLLDPKTRPWLVIGGEPQDRRALIDLYAQVYNANVSIRQVSRLEAEVIKVSENRAIAYKLAQCQELYDVCERAGVDYYTVRDTVYGDDPRFNLWWTFVYPDKRGMQSKCLPKDVYAWAAWAESLGYEPVVTRAILEKNKEWISASLSLAGMSSS